MQQMVVAVCRVTALEMDGTRSGRVVQGSDGWLQYGSDTPGRDDVELQLDVADWPAGMVVPGAGVAVEVWTGAGDAFWYQLFPRIDVWDLSVMVQPGGCRLSVQGVLTPNPAWGPIDVPGADGSMPRCPLDAETFWHGQVTTGLPAVR